MNKKDITEISGIISSDTHNLISSLLLYRIAAKVLSAQEINTIIDSGAETIVEQLSNHIDKNITEKVVKDTSENIRDLIHKINVNGI